MYRLYSNDYRMGFFFFFCCRSRSMRCSSSSLRFRKRISSSCVTGGGGGGAAATSTALCGDCDKDSVPPALPAAPGSENVTDAPSLPCDRIAAPADPPATLAPAVDRAEHAMRCAVVSARSAANRHPYAAAAQTVVAIGGRRQRRAQAGMGRFLQGLVQRCRRAVPKVGQASGRLGHPLPQGL